MVKTCAHNLQSAATGGAPGVLARTRNRRTTATSVLLLSQVNSPNRLINGLLLAL